ncbi:hypothetical protein [Rhizobium phage RHEph15]|uniref:Uncharacterized protein n=1 Tax=Rhizobium phage RHph_TM34 TaxID=2509556 RepID=A0A7S5R325_9CAUD|nr:hypothetical protein EVB35_030 [Rhizobium phage RHph_TM34]QXV74291.1 hypothetical protein [Rhizobium phage RHEph15]QXV74985.1 hypothetical protein [Rhizobium phage RHEph27]
MGIETLLLGGLAAASVASTLFQPQPSVPKAQVPAVAADAARSSGATVQVGVQDEKKEDGDTSYAKPFVEQRKQAKTITGLGRGGLAI